MCGSMVDIQSAAAENRRGKRRKKGEEAKYWAATKSSEDSVRVIVSGGCPKGGRDSTHVGRICVTA